MSTNTFIPILKNGLVFYVDAYNRKSYVSGDTVSNDLVSNDLGKTDFIFTVRPAVSDIYGNEVFIVDGGDNRSSIYNLDTDTSYKFSNIELGRSGGIFAVNEIVNGKPVVYAKGGDNLDTNNIRRFEYQSGTTWSNTLTQSLATTRRHGTLQVDNYSTISGRSDLWLSTSNNSSSTYLTLHQWNGSSYDEYDFTSNVSSFLTYGNKFTVQTIPVSYGRVFVVTFTYNAPLNGSVKQSSIIDMEYTGGTYTNPSAWTTTLIAGGNTTFGDTDGELGTNTLAFGQGNAAIRYRGKVKNGQPHLYFHNRWPPSWGNPSGNDESYFRELFWNGSAWEVNTFYTFPTTDIIQQAALNPDGNKLYYYEFNNNDELYYYDIPTSGITSVVPIAESGSEQERVPKTIDLINGVGFNDKGWDFDGVNDYIEIPSVSGVTSFDENSDYTISFWAYMDTSLGGTQIPLEKWDEIPTPYPYSFRFLRSPDRLAIQVYDGSTAQATTPVNITQDKWNHITGVFDWTNNTLTAYINGEYASDGTINITGVGNNINAFVGSRNGSSLFMKGNISTVRMWSGALNAQEIKQDYNNTKWRFI